MNKPQQAAYHSIFAGVKNLSDEIQVPALSGEELYNVFFQMRLDHPEIFWVTNFKYRYYKDSPNLIFIPEYLTTLPPVCHLGCNVVFSADAAGTAAFSASLPAVWPHDRILKKYWNLL